MDLAYKIFILIFKHLSTEPITILISTYLLTGGTNYDVRDILVRPLQLI